MFDEEPKSRNISNSEVTAFLSCKRMYNFAFVDKLQPKEISVPLARGTLGHFWFELYWKARQQGADHNEAIAKGNEAFTSPPQDTPIEVIMETQFLVHRYIAGHQGLYANRWEVLGVEEQFDLPLTSTINMTIKYDLYLLDKETGKRYILDYKFTYDFWSTDDHDLNGQMPKYISVMQANGLQVDGGYLEEIRTRPLGKEKASDPKNLWRRTPYLPSFARKQSMLTQHVATALEIEKHRNLTPEERTAVSLPVLNKHGACKYCNFKDLCNSMIEGKKDLSVDIRTKYEQNTYDYNKTDEVLGL